MLIVGCTLAVSKSFLIKADEISYPYLSTIEPLDYTNGNVARGHNFDVDHDYFESVVWPAVAHRLGYERIEKNEPYPETGII